MLHPDTIWITNSSKVKTSIKIKRLDRRLMSTTVDVKLDMLHAR